MRRFLAFLLLVLVVACGGSSSGSGPSNPPPPPPPVKKPVPTGIFKKVAVGPLAQAVVTLSDPVMIINQLDATTSDFHLTMPSLKQCYGRVSYNPDNTLSFTTTGWACTPTGGSLVSWDMSGTYSNGSLSVTTPEGTFVLAAQTPVPESGTYVGTFTATDTSTGLATTLTISGSDIRIQDSTRDVTGRIQPYQSTQAIYKIQVYSANDQYHSLFGLMALDPSGNLTFMAGNTTDQVPANLYAYFVRVP